MTRIPIVALLAVVALNATAAPTFHKRIAQTISASTQKWEASCLAAGGADQCNPLSIKAFSTLLAAAGPCEQQDAADEMVDLAKNLNNNSDMIKFAQIFAQQPRNSPNSVAIPYCQTAPKNTELSGLYQCQFQGSDQTTFAGSLKVGANGTIPFGLSSPLSPAGSCPANPQGPIADGTQLVDQVKSSGASGSGDGATNATVSATASFSGTPSAASFTTSASAVASVASSTESGAAGSQCVNAGGNVASSVATSSSGSATSIPNTDVTPTSVTTDDTTATASLITTTPVIASATTAAPVSITASTSSSASASPSGDAASDGDFHLKNGQDAQALNAKFSRLTAESPCNAGDQVCVNGGFAQCVGGKLVATQCAGGTSCFALPLVNKPGTSIACTTQDDAAARIRATGVRGGITGQ